MNKWINNDWCELVKFHGVKLVDPKELVVER